MDGDFFDRPILNSPYAHPGQHWELDADGQPTNRIIAARRRSELITPVPKPKKSKKKPHQQEMLFDAGDDLSTLEQAYNPTPIINEIRQYVDTWRNLPNPDQWQVSPETARLLQHWRHHRFQGIRPFFCQVEAVETAIWLTEVAPRHPKVKTKFWDHLKGANEQSNPELLRIALKLATGAGKTTVMAMLIAWHTVNAVRHPGSKQFSRGFLIVAPGITIRDRLRVLLPNDPESYYSTRELIPADMIGDIERAKIVITNYHAFRLRERLEVSKVGRALLKGRGPDLLTTETEGQMLQRVMPDLMGLKHIVCINDEAHHCYRERPLSHEEEELKGDEKDEAKKNNEAARLWISGLETVKRKLGTQAVYDLSATPFFLRGSGYAEGTLFPWTVSDFSLMDAIECGIVKLPRVPVADNIAGAEMPKFRNLWAPHRQADAEEGPRQRKGSTPSRSPPSFRRRWKPSTATTPRPSNSGRKRASASRRSSSASATTPPPRSWSTTSSPASTAPWTTAPPSSKMAASRSFATSTSMATVSRARAPCSSTPSSSNPARPSTPTSATWPRTRSTASAARSSSAPAICAPPTSSRTPTCSARS
jgi:type III restriction enzyme